MAAASCSGLQPYTCSEPTASLLGLAVLASCAAPSGDPTDPAPGPAPTPKLAAPMQESSPAECAPLSLGLSPECGRSKSSEATTDGLTTGRGTEWLSDGLEVEPCCAAATSAWGRCGAAAAAGLAPPPPPLPSRASCTRGGGGGARSSLRSSPELGVSRLSSPVALIGTTPPCIGTGRRIFAGLTSGLGTRLSELAAEEARTSELLMEGCLSPKEGRSGVLQEARIISGVTEVERPEADGMRSPCKPTPSMVVCLVRRRAPGLVREEEACMACVSRSACVSSRCSSHTCVPSILHWRRRAAASASALSTRCCSAALPRSLCCFARGMVLSTHSVASLHDASQQQLRRWRAWSS
mmetsp:Transcript_42094/g.101348  ORF Transcript_42094/g.101348 Transcript_42094/m.101348 type:complete len:353 (-) Transcript_42094:181-1239(-)